MQICLHISSCQPVEGHTGVYQIPKETKCYIFEQKRNLSWVMSMYMILSHFISMVSIQKAALKLRRYRCPNSISGQNPLGSRRATVKSAVRGQSSVTEIWWGDPTKAALQFTGFLSKPNTAAFQPAVSGSSGSRVPTKVSSWLPGVPCNAHLGAHLPVYEGGVAAAPSSICEMQTLRSSMNAYLKEQRLPHPDFG